MKRRQFLRNSAVTGMAAAPLSKVWTWTNAPRPLAGGQNKLVIANMLGGWDTLQIFPPHATTQYATRRPGIAVAAPDPLNPDAALPLVPGIGLHPAMAPLHPLFGSNEMTVVQKVGYPNPSLSHFTSQDIMSRAVRDEANPDRRGWLGRLGDLHLGQPLQIVGLGTGNRIDFRAYQNAPSAIDSLAEFTVPGNPFDAADSDHRNRVARRVLDASGNPTGLRATAQSAAQSVFDLVDQVGVAVQGYTSTVQYPDTRLGRSLQDVARLIQSPVQSQVFYVQRGGFDNHSNIVDSMNASLVDVSTAMAAFIDDLRAMNEWQNTTIVVISEFGRRNFENGSAGTDHGQALHFMLLGGSLSGGLRGTNVTDQDLLPSHLQMQIDFRQVYGEIVANRFGIDPNPLFPDYQMAPASLNLF